MAKLDHKRNPLQNRGSQFSHFLDRQELEDEMEAMSQKELDAEIKALEILLTALKPVWDKYLDNWRRHIAPIYKQAQRYHHATFRVEDLRKKREALIAEAATESGVKIEKLPYAPKSMVGKKMPKMTDEQRNMKIAKNMDPELLEKLLKMAEGVK